MSSTTRTETFLAPDISCVHCVMTVKGAFGALDGVQHVKASSETKEVTVAFSPTQVSTTEIESTLAEVGYPVQR